MINTKNPKLILASASPRRKQLLQQIGLVFEVKSADIDESVLPGEQPEPYVQRMAAEKAAALGRSDDWVLAADTTVVLGSEIFSKPENQVHAAEMMAQLAGNEHVVLTAVALSGPDKYFGATISRTLVRFKPLSSQEINAYWQTGEPLDKAGGYAIQGKAALFIESMQGSYTGAVGLPLFETGKLLESAGFNLYGGESND